MKKISKEIVKKEIINILTTEKDEEINYIKTDKRTKKQKDIG